MFLPALALAACSEPAPPAEPADAEGAALLADVDGEAFAQAFDRLAATPYAAELSVTTEAGGEKTTETAQAHNRPGESVVETAGAVRLRDPIASALTGDPPYLDPATRDAYRVEVLPDTTVSGVRLRRVEAVLTDADRELSVRRVRAAVDPSGRVASVEVERRTGSAVFSEDSRVRVDLDPVSRLPRRVVTDSQTDVPLSPPRRVRSAWTVRAGA